MFDFIQNPTNILSTKDKRAYDRAALREERDMLAGQMMLSSYGRSRLAELNAILGG